MCARRRVGVEQVDGRQRGERADLAGEIAAAHADRLRDALAALRDQAGHLLHAGARRADDADVAARHAVGEGERHAADDGGAAVGAHHQAAQRRGLALEGDFLFEGHVVAEDHHVEPARSALRASAAA